MTMTGDDSPRLLTGVRNGTWLDAQDFPPLRYAVPDLIPEGLGLNVGAPKIGKSWFVLHVALAVARGGRAFGIPVEPRPVLYLALEDGHRRLQDRCRKLLPGEAIPEGFEYLTVVEPGQVVPTLAAWFAISHTPEAPAFAVTDTLGKVMPPALQGESSYQRDYRIGSALKRVADDHPGSTLLLNHHDRKAGAEDFVDRVSGTNGLAGAADTIMVLSRQRGGREGSLAVTGRDVVEGEYSMNFDGALGLWSLTGGSLAAAATALHTRRAVEGLDDRSRSIVEHVGAYPEGQTAFQVAAALGLDPKATGTYLARLHDAGRIVRHTRGVYGPVESVESVESHESAGPVSTLPTLSTHPQEEE